MGERTAQPCTQYAASKQLLHLLANNQLITCWILLLLCGWKRKGTRAWIGEKLLTVSKRHRVNFAPTQMQASTNQRNSFNTYCCRQWIPLPFVSTPRLFEFLMMGLRPLATRVLTRSASWKRCSGYDFSATVCLLPVFFLITTSLAVNQQSRRSH